MSLFSKIRRSFSKFMYGRYGNDSLNHFLIILWLFETIVNLFVQSLVLYGLGLILCIVVFYRMLSKNTVKRMRENAAWYDFSKNQKASARLFAVRIRDRKIAHFFKCPNCKAPIRMPRKIGKFNIRCSKCGHTFSKEFKK